MGSYVLYLIGFVVGFHSLGVFHTDEGIFLFVCDIAFGIDR